MPKTKRKYVIVRTYSAGVFAGYLESRAGKEVVMTEARRLWYSPGRSELRFCSSPAWMSAASLSQLAQEGTSKPKECKFPVAVAQVELTEAIEILNVTEAAQKSITEVPVWRE